MLGSDKSSTEVPMIVDKESVKYRISSFASKLLITPTPKTGSFINVVNKGKNVKMKVLDVNHNGGLNATANGKNYYCVKTDNKWVVKNQI